MAAGQEAAVVVAVQLAHINADLDGLAEDEEEGQQARLKSRWAALPRCAN